MASLLEKFYNVVGRGACLAAGRVSLDAVGWKNEEDNAICARTRALENAVTLTHVDSSKHLGVFTDGLNYFWAAS